MTGLVPLLLAPVAPAADVLDGANLLGMGGVGAAASRDNAAITLNPGLLALHPRYDFLGQFRYGPSAAMSWGVSALDARTSDVVALGLAYSGDRSDPVLEDADLPGWTVPGAEITNRKRFHDFAGGLAVPVLDRRIGFGLGFVAGLYDHDRQGSGWTFDLHAGAGLRPVDWLVLGAAVRDFVGGQEQDRPLSVVGGLRLEAPEAIAVETNATWTDAYTTGLPVTLAAGLELPVDAARFRMGWRRDADVGVHSVTAGLGWEREGAGIEYATRVPLSHTSFGAVVHQVSIRFGAPEDILAP